MLRGAPFFGACMSALTMREKLSAEVPSCLTAESAVRDCIGKGHNPDIAPLSGIVAKLKAQQAALAAKYVQLVAAVAGLLSHAAGVTQQNSVSS